MYYLPIERVMITSGLIYRREIGAISRATFINKLAALEYSAAEIEVIDTCVAKDNRLTTKWRDG